VIDSLCAIAAKSLSHNLGRIGKSVLQPRLRDRLYVFISRRSQLPKRCIPSAVEIAGA